MSDNVEKLDDHRRKTISVAFVGLPPEEPKPEGPFTVTVADKDGVMFEVTFPDFSGELPDGHQVRGTAGPNIPQVLLNLLTGTLRVFLGVK